MNPAALFAAHKTAILGTAAAGVAGLALMRKRSAAKTGATAGATVPGTIPAAAVTADGFMGPDSSAYDVYNALMPELEALRQTVGTSVGSVPTPVATSPILSTMPNLRQSPSYWRAPSNAKTVRLPPAQSTGVVGTLPKYMP